MKLYFVCYYLRSGGPEAIHQTCDLANQLGYDAYVLYFFVDALPAPIPPAPIVNLYGDTYKHVKLTSSIINDPTSIVFLPEMFHIEDFKRQQNLPHPKFVMWWLSYNAGINVLFENNYANAPYFNAFQSHYAKDKVRTALANINIDRDAHSFKLTDYINPIFHTMSWDVKDKKNMVAYNPAKDIITPEFCKLYNIPCVALANMSSSEIINTLMQCKVYIDCGTHPGKDRMPREAALLGCVVLTNKLGSAGYIEDVPIKQRYDTVPELYDGVQRVFNNYAYEISSQEHYRIIIKNEFNTLKHELIQLVQAINTMNN